MHNFWLPFIRSVSVSQASFYPPLRKLRQGKPDKYRYFIPPAPKPVYSQIPFYLTGLKDTAIIVEMIKVWLFLQPNNSTSCFRKFVLFAKSTRWAAFRITLAVLPSHFGNSIWILTGVWSRRLESFQLPCLSSSQWCCLVLGPRRAFFWFCSWWPSNWQDFWLSPGSNWIQSRLSL